MVPALYIFQDLPQGPFRISGSPVKKVGAAKGKWFMKKDDTYRFRFSFMQLSGMILIILGITLMTASAIRGKAIKKAVIREYEELCEEEDMDADMLRIEAERQSRIKAADEVHKTIIGGLIVILGAPLFYSPFADWERSFRRSRKSDAERRKKEKDSEFDYPDDEFDFVLDKEVREQLIRERDENIRKKKEKNKW